MRAVAIALSVVSMLPACGSRAAAPAVPPAPPEPPAVEPEQVQTGESAKSGPPETSAPSDMVDNSAVETPTSEVEQDQEEDVWRGWLSADPSQREGPSAERVGDDCLLTDLQYMDAPLFEVRASVGRGWKLRPRFDGKLSKHDLSGGTILRPGTLVLGSQVVGGHRCVYSVSSRGLLVAGFVPAEHLRQVPDPPSAPLPELVGTWASGGWHRSKQRRCPPDHFTISVASGGSFDLKGEASWCCGCTNYDTHTGEIEGEVSFANAEGSVAGDCRLVFRQRGPFLMVGDDQSCGGMNVSFTGIYLPAK